MAQLTNEQRYTIYAMRKEGYNQKKIAEAIGKDKSVVSRELMRNSNDKGKYILSIAKELVSIRKERLSKSRKFTEEVRLRVEKLLKERWSPQQIVGWCKKKGYAIVSIERIYQHIREDKEKGGVLYSYCRHKLKNRKRPVGKCVVIRNRVSIEERPIEADGTRFGDWEMDTIIGADHKGAMLTLVEKQTGYTIIEPLKYGRNAKELAKVVIELLLPYKDSVLTITTDNGTEFAEHEMIAKKLNTNIYFAHPYSSWEKGLIEYCNKLYRQYIPKKSNFSSFNRQQIKEIQYQINERPRRKLGYCCPKDIFFSYL